MIIGFLGKGGSGKSTLATLTNHYLVSSGQRVLAIDADHNMDFTYNILGENMPELDNFFGQSYDYMQELFDFRDKKYDQFVVEQEAPVFRLNPLDEYSDKYISKLNDRQMLMVAGEHNQDILHGQKCSHSLATPLKVYLPLLELGEEEFVIVDYLAGSDGAATGIVAGMDFVVVVVEDTPHSVKAAKQISELLDFFSVPYGYALNKDRAGKYRFIEEEIESKLLFMLPLLDIYELDFHYDMTELLTAIDEKKSKNSRLERSKYKFRSNLTYYNKSNV